MSDTDSDKDECDSAPEIDDPEVDNPQVDDPSCDQSSSQMQDSVCIRHKSALCSKRASHNAIADIV